MAAYAFGWRAGTVCTPVTTDREAEHMQVAVVVAAVGLLLKV